MASGGGGAGRLRSLRVEITRVPHVPTDLEPFLGWLCRRSPADWQRLIYTLKELHDFADTHTHTHAHTLTHIHTHTHTHTPF